MSNTFKNTLIQSIRDAAVYDSGSLQAPVAILWPDPERQWVASEHILIYAGTLLKTLIIKSD